MPTSSFVSKNPMPRVLEKGEGWLFVSLPALWAVATIGENLGKLANKHARHRGGPKRTRRRSKEETRSGLEDLPACMPGA